MSNSHANFEANSTRLFGLFLSLVFLSFYCLPAMSVADTAKIDLNDNKIAPNRDGKKAWGEKALKKGRNDNKIAPDRDGEKAWGGSKDSNVFGQTEKAAKSTN